MFRRKEMPAGDPLPFGLRSDLAKAGEKLVYRARTFHAPFGKEGEALQRDFLAECRLSVLVFLHRKGTLTNVDVYAYSAAFPGADPSADVKNLMPRAAMRTLGPSFVQARQRGFTQVTDLTLSETEQLTLEPLWSIIEFISVLPGHRGGREFIIGEQGRLRAYLAERGGLKNATQTGQGRHPTLVDAPRHPTLIGLETTPPSPAPPTAPQSGGGPLAPREPDPASDEPTLVTHDHQPPNPRPLQEVFTAFPWASFTPHAQGLPDGKFFLPAPLAPTLDHAALRYRTTKTLLGHVIAPHGLSEALATARRTQQFLLGAFLSAGLGVTVRDVRVLERVAANEPELLNLDAWRTLSEAIHTAAHVQSVAAFLPGELHDLMQGANREVGEDIVASSVEGLLVLLDALLAFGSDDDGSRAAFRQRVYVAQLERARRYLPDSRARALEQLAPTPQPPSEALGDALGRRFAQLPASLQVPVHNAERLEALRGEFARHFLALFASAVRQAQAPHFLHHSVTVMNGMAGVQRSAREWCDWHDEALITFALDPFVFQPEYLRTLLHAASANATWRSTLDRLLETVRSLIVTYAEDVLGGVGLDEVRQGFERLDAAVQQRLAPAVPMPTVPPADMARAPEPDPKLQPPAATDEPPAAPPNTTGIPTAATTPDATALDEVLQEDAWDDDWRVEQVIHTSSTPNAGTADDDLPGFEFFETDFQGVQPPVIPEPLTQAISSRAAPATTETPDDVMRDVNALAGAADIKRHLQQLANLAKVREMRISNGLPVAELSIHLVFSGPRGTGRATVAGLVGRLYKALGFLDHATVTRVDAASLTAGEFAETTSALLAAFERARGGVLLIDRAYALAEQDMLGVVTNALLRRLNEHAGEVAVIVAGEADRMENFLNSNPALPVKFSRIVTFERFGDAELQQILADLAEQHGYRLAPAAVPAAQRALDELANRSREVPGTPHVQRVFELALANHANRVANLTTVTPDDLVRLDAEDFTPVDE